MSAIEFRRGPKYSLCIVLNFYMQLICYRRLYNYEVVSYLNHKIISNFKNEFSNKLHSLINVEKQNTIIYKLLNLSPIFIIKQLIRLYT